MNKSNYCLVDPEGGSLRVQLSVDNGIRSGSLFVLWEKQSHDWVEKERFNLITGDDGIDDQILIENPNEIENDCLAWNIQACAIIHGANQGMFTVNVYQGDKKLWSKISDRRVPYCEEGENILFGNQVIFKHIATNETNFKLWRQIER